MKFSLRDCLILSCFVFILIACRDKSLEIQTEMLPGKYCFNEGTNDDSLILYKSKAYVHKYISSKMEVFESQGKWEYDSAALKMSFYDFIFYNESGPINSPGGVWHSRLHITSEGEIRLMYSRENNIFYYKE